MMGENEKILNLIQDLMKNDILADFLRDYDFSVNLFGLKISDSRHLFLRLSQPKDEIILWLQEEYIPKMDHTGNWIQYPAIENPRVERIEPSSKYIPTDLNYGEFVNNLLGFFDQLKAYKASHLHNVDLDQLNRRIDEMIQEIKTLSQLN